MRKLTYWLAGLFLIGVAIGAVLLLNNIQEITWQAAEHAVCEATVADAGGADINTAFRFTFESDVSANAVRRFLSVQPPVELNFHQGVQAHEVLAVPVTPLQPGALYHFSLVTEGETLSWVFQTKREDRDTENQTADIWQYLALSKESYESGDTVDFWGYMRRRDNNDWEWSRVSVYVYAEGDDEDPVAQGYAPLVGNIFSGGLQLPRLLDGLYQLQIWQSGHMLIVRPFAVGDAPVPASPPAEGQIGEGLSVDIVAAGAQSLRFNVLDSLGAVPAKAVLLSGAYQADGETLFFGELPLDKNGQAELSVSLPPGTWQIWAQSIADVDPPLAGRATFTYEGPTESTPVPLPKTPLPVPPLKPITAWATRYDMSAGASHLLREGLLFFSSAERVQAMELLWQALFTMADSAEQRLSAAAARLLWQRHGYADFDQGIIPPTEVRDLQQADGGLAAGEDGPSELLLSMLGAAFCHQGGAELDSFALARYLRGAAQDPAPFTDKALALAGLAALGKPVLQEIKLLLPQAQALPEARAALICGLALAGDTQVAKAALHDLLAAYASDATAGIFYLEGGQGENIRLNRLAALAAGAAGEAHTTFLLLQYLQNQQGQHDFITVFSIGGLLDRLYISHASATMSLNNRPYTVELSAFSNLWLNQPAPGDLLVEEAEGDMAMTCLRLM